MTREEANQLYQLAVANMLEFKLKDAEHKLDQLIGADSIDLEKLFQAHLHKLMLNRNNKDERANLSAIMSDRFANTEYGAKVYEHLAQFHHIVGDRDREVAALEHLVNNYPEATDQSLLDLAVAYHYHTKNIRGAIMHYVRYLNAVGTNGKNAETAAVNLADCYNAIGEVKEARRVLNTYMGRA